MTEKSFTAPSGTEFTYQVDAAGRLSKNDLITWVDDEGRTQYLRGADLVALAVHWIEGQIVERQAATDGQSLVYTDACQWCTNDIASITGDDGSWYETDEEGSVGFTTCPDSRNDKHEPINAK